MVLDLGGSQPGSPGPGEARGRSIRGIWRPGVRRQQRTSLLYERVVDLVEQIIADQALGPGDKLPSYTELADRAGVSLITVRRALDELERVGRVRRHQGLGTFVARPRIVTEPGRAGSLLSTIADESAAKKLTTKVLGLHKGQP